MKRAPSDLEGWTKSRIKEGEFEKYLRGTSDFIPDTEIYHLLSPQKAPDPGRVREILSKSLFIQSLTPSETAELIRVTDPDTLSLMKETALKIKKKVYDNRIVTFAPLYLGNRCVNNCLYCGFRKDNSAIDRNVLNQEEIRREVEVLAGKIGHKRLVLVFGEHPSTDIDYILECIKTVYDVKTGPLAGSGKIRRVSINSAPLSVADLKKLHAADIGTYQVFQETYHRDTYRRLHPEDTPKSHFRWRLYSHHRALEAGIQDVSVGALFGLYDWRWEVLGLVYHGWDLERNFGLGPHTVSFPRLEPALNTPYTQKSPYRVSDEDFLKILTIIRLALPYTGMVVTAREKPKIRQEALQLGITQEDASSNVGIGAYQKSIHQQEGERQQFFLGDMRSLSELIQDLAEKDTITSFCTKGYRCERVGKCIQDLLRSGKEGEFCKLNAVLTFKEWVDDFGTEDLKSAAEGLLKKEISEIQAKMPHLYPAFFQAYQRVQAGERDLLF